MTEERDMWHMRWQKEVPPLEKEIKTIAERRDIAMPRTSLNRNSQSWSWSLGSKVT